eukprot:CAMPEP_0206310372 /NCGR_PEP_ID=MMETSP0106_2-20121207/12889_1 /ASSEMBLY_ACC=CAM_ASM_000206 /TAXON_ID=81532 /ORGANISM="Acanthoeca-like sp., Strain 10tr" /LENGTH=154 /DNA_ID=CAMNT_0053741537 /DNA_START=126 /DNA_END=590 /DNA_ORIENTATION=+
MALTAASSDAASDKVEAAVARSGPPSSAAGVSGSSSSSSVKGLRGGIIRRGMPRAVTVGGDAATDSRPRGSVRSSRPPPRDGITPYSPGWATGTGWCRAGAVDGRGRGSTPSDSSTCLFTRPVGLVLVLVLVPVPVPVPVPRLRPPQVFCAPPA